MPGPPPASPGPRLRREAATIARLAGPVVGGQLAITGLGFIDTLMAGRLGPETLAAVAVGASVWASLNMFLLGTLLAVPPFVAQLDGAGRLERVAPLARQAAWLALGLGLLLAGAAAAARPLLVALDVQPEIVPLTLGYLHALAWGIPAYGLYLALRFLSEGLGATRPVLYFGVLGLPVNALGNWLLMYGRGGFPELGAVGCGYATAAVWVAQLVGILLYVVLHPRYRHLGLFSRLEAPHLRRIGEILAVGAPIAVTLFVEVSVFAAVALLMASMGTYQVAGHQVAINFAAMTFMVPLGISMAISVRVGNAVGRRDAPGVRFSARVGTGLALGFQAVAAMVMLLFPRAVARLYTSDPRVVAVAAELLVLAALFQLSDGVQASAAGALRGVRDTRIPMAIVVVAYWLIGLPLGWWLAFGLGLGARGLWMGLIAGLTAAAALLAVRFHRVAARPLPP